jgi:hypothetical protein
MPTTIDSAGITFNDATSLTSANIGTAQLVNGSVIASKLGTTEQKQICKAWVNFDGTTSPGTIRSQYNVSSVTKNGTGDYIVNFATAMADANYSISVSAALNTNNPSVIQYQDQSTSSVREIVRVNSVAYDPTHLSLQVFGN